MSGFNQNTWYVLKNGLSNDNNTLTAVNNTEAAFNPSSPSSIYYAPLNNDSVPTSQQWQIFPITSGSTSSSAFLLRNRQLGPNAFLTATWTTRKCGGGACATVPVMAPYLDAESLWEFGDWGFSDAIGGTIVYNLGNGSNWRLDTMYSGPDSELTNTTDTGAGGQHWFFSAHTALAATESSAFATIPTNATAALAQFTSVGASFTPSITINPSGTASASSGSGSATPTSGSSASSPDSTSSSKSGLSSGAAAGIGVGVAVAVIAAFIIAFILFRRHRRQRAVGSSANPAEIAQPDNRSYYGEAAKATPGLSNPQTPNSASKAEMSAYSMSSRVELSASPRTPGGGVGHDVQRHELPVSPIPHRSEMEDPSTTASTVPSSTDGHAGSDEKRRLI